MIAFRGFNIFFFLDFNERKLYDVGTRGRYGTLLFIITWTTYSDDDDTAFCFEKVLWILINGTAVLTEKFWFTEVNNYGLR